ncbi:MAG TPA: EutN/CcmL family microcompartment protein [Vicinamibacterales bacterium]|jgi:microcompartment protein CcmK/EutM
MTVGTVTGHIHSTISHEFYQARTLLLVEREDAGGQPTGAYLIAVDAVGAGVGERVLVLDEGNGARQVMGSTNAPVRSVIVGIIDDVQSA